MNEHHARLLAFLGALAAVSAFAPNEHAHADEKDADPSAVTVRWKDGIRFETADKKNQFHVGGRIHYDWAFFREDDDLRDAAADDDEFLEDLEDGAELRRARLIAEGLINGNIEFKNEFDFAGARVQARDVFVGLRELPVVGTLRIGHFKEPFSLEEITSSVHITFLERSLANNFAPSRNAGVMLTNTFADERITASAGYFRDADAGGGSRGDGENNGTARITALPVWQDDGRTLVHLGGAASIRNPTGEAMQIRAKPEANLAPVLVDTGTLGAESQMLFGGEAAVVHGPLAVQGEVSATSLSALTGPDPSFMGYYVAGSWFLTGESQSYRRASGAFGDVVPAESFSGDGGGPGAWQLAARYSRIELDDGDIVSGGTLSDVTLGLNWYPNTITRFMANIVLADAEDLGKMTSILTRVQVVF